MNFIRDHNILIPTKSDKHASDTHQQANSAQVNEEVRRLHITVKQRETLLGKVRGILASGEGDQINKLN